MQISKSTNTRRGILAALVTVIGGACAFRKVVAAGLTPSAAEGPFYPTPAMRKTDADNDLVKVIGLVNEAGGEVITLKGSVTNKDGAPQAGMRVEIWQCDMNGKYLHSGDNRKVTYDQGFQGFGYDITDPNGNYKFRTIKPGKYPGRTPHIYVKVLHGSREILTTQFYESDHSENARDSLFRRMSNAQAAMVTMKYRPRQRGEEATVNIVV